jgi:predicted RND superfamily exporter protein
MTRIWTARIAVAILTIASFWLTATRLSLSGDLTSLFPDRGDAAALTRFTHAFGGGDVATILVRGESPEEVQAAAEEVGAALATKPSVAHVATRVRGADRSLDPTLAWAYAGPIARARLEQALTPEGMKQRLEETRTMLLAPGSGAAEEWLARDPLRLAQIPWEARGELAAGLLPSDDGSFVAAGGKARLIVVQPKGSAFNSVAANAFVRDAEEAMAHVARDHPATRLAISGGHAIAVASEKMITRDLEVSASLSLLLASLAFVVTFHRARALAAVLPPLVVGTVWTTGLVAVFMPQLSAISIGFMAVVVGVGVDTGVHVYAALLEARRSGLAPHEAAHAARRKTARPTLLAAIAAGTAFASLALSDLSALRQLGLLCALGEVLTAIAILLMTPEIGALLERGKTPAPLRPPWLRLVAAATRTRGRAWTTVGVALVPIAFLLVAGWPQAGSAVVALRPHGLAPLRVQDEIYALFGGERGQWVVLAIDGDPGRAVERGDRLAEALDRLVAQGVVSSYDALTSFAPSPAIQRDRLAARDALGLPALAPRLEEALKATGFDPDACAPALDAFRHPSSRIAPLAAPSDEVGWIVARHRATEAPGASDAAAAGDTLVALYVRPRDDEASDARALEALHAADPGVLVTGYTHLEAALKRTLSHDLPRVALCALVLVAIALRAALGRAGDVALAILTVVAELAIVAALMRIFHLRWHVYDALVLPVLIGITIDEAMFLLHAARSAKAEDDAVGHTLLAQGPLVASTALTTAAGFAALLACGFDGLYDLGAVGALGSVAGLLCALLLVPAGLRLTRGVVT